MKEEKKQNFLGNINIAVCLVLFVVLQILIMGPDKWGLRALNGVFLSLQFGLCLLMIHNRKKIGGVLAIACMVFSVISTAVSIIRLRMLSPLPGLFNAVFYVITLILLSRIYKIRVQESITDVITGLLNRRGFNQIIKERILKNKAFYLVYVDLVNFKYINDNYGHACGDEILHEVSVRIQKCVGNRITVARLGGDEFVFLTTKHTDVEMLCEKILGRLRESVVINDNGNSVTCYIDARIGISAFPDNSDSYEELIKEADAAMYYATKNSSKGYEFYNESMELLSKRQLEMEKTVKEGLEAERFFMVYQPQFNMKDRNLRGFEALLRLKNEDGSITGPGELIAAAEKSHLIKQVDEYVFRHVFKDFNELVKQSRKKIVVSVNVSANDMCDPEFCEKLLSIMAEYDYPADSLEVEITEYALANSISVVVGNIKRLKEIGIQVALDDFGTGYTSLSYLAKLPINLLKIDKSLVDDIENNQKSREFVEAVVSMGHIMGCEVISEGVETEGQLAILSNRGSDFVQGYVWGKPLSKDVAIELALRN